MGMKMQLRQQQLLLLQQQWLEISDGWWDPMEGQGKDGCAS